MPASASTGGGELTGAVADEEPEAVGLVAEVHQEVAGLLGGPRPVRMAGHAQDLQVAIADFECEQDVDPAERDGAVDVEEVDGEHGGCLGAQELAPAGVGVPVGVPVGSQWEAAPVQDPADGRGADAVAEVEEFALDGESAWGAVAGFPRLRFPRPLSE
jgi:hypothetical protein